MRYLKWVIVTLISGGLSYLIALHGLTASALDRDDPRSALALNPRSASALSSAGDQALAAGDYSAAEQYAKAALTRMPRDVRALRVLGIALSVDGQPRLGTELLLRAGALSWRDDVTQIWLIRQAVDQKNYLTATQRIDAMLRRKRRTAEMLVLLHQLAALPAAQPAVIERIAESPPWRRAFFVNMEHLPASAALAHAALIGALREREGIAPREEVAWFVGHLAKIGNFALAREVWLGAVPGDQHGLAHGVFDGDFSLDPLGASDQPRHEFEWTLGSGAGAFAAIGSPPGLIGETALNLRSNGEAETVLAEQLIMLSPGAHALSHDSMIGEGLTPDAFEWRVRCAAGGERLALAPKAGKTVGPWRSITARFDVPAGCPAQRIQVVAPAGADAAEAWLDRVRVL